MACGTTKITQNISYDCTPAGRAKAGLESKAVIINKSDLDLTALTVSGASVTNLSLASGSTGYSIEWIKQLANTASEYVANESGVDTYSHSFVGRIFGQTAADAERAKELKDGEFVVIVESKFKGADNLSAYKVFGLENGLRMSEASFTSLENDGAFLFTLASVEGYGESYPYQVWSEGTYVTNKAKFDALFAE